VKKVEEKPRVGVLENAPPWWPNFKPPEFSEEELCEIERYCKKIVENVGKEKGMTPKERWKTTWNLGIPDRPLVASIHNNLVVARVLDGWSDSLKPGIDLHWYPKLCVKGHLAYVARFNMEVVHPYGYTYGDTEYGGRSRAKLVPYAAPAVVEAPIKTEADFEMIHIPDLDRDGFYPAYLWMVRKIKEFMKKHGVADVMPMKADFCAEPASAGVVLRGMKQHMIDVRRNPEIVRRCAEIDLEFKIKYGKAVLEAGADFMGCCSFGGFMGLELYKKLDIDKYNRALVKALPPNSFVFQIGFDQSQVIEYLCQTGSVSHGFILSHETPTEIARSVATKYKLHFTSMIDPMLVVSGPKEKIVENVKNNIKLGAGPGYWFCGGFSDYWSLPEYVELVIKTAKEYGAELYKELRG
jgi:uroporphyrinogen-III decarboxylase